MFTSETNGKNVFQWLSWLENMVNLKIQLKKKKSILSTSAYLASYCSLFCTNVQLPCVLYGEIRFLCWCRCTGGLLRRSSGSAHTKESKLRFVWHLSKHSNFYYSDRDKALIGLPLSELGSPPPCSVSLRIGKSFMWECSSVLFSTLWSPECYTQVQIKARGEALTLWSPAQLLGLHMCVTCLYFCGWANKALTLAFSGWILLQVECRNYIRTLHKVNDTTMYVCGTNAFSPTCDYIVSIEQNSIIWDKTRSYIKTQNISLVRFKVYIFIFLQFISCDI